jgi:hypothetical protein
MDDISNKTTEELLEIVDNTDDKEVLRYIANELEVSFSGNTGVGTLKEKILPVLLERQAAENEPSTEVDEDLMGALTNKTTTETAEVLKKKSVMDLPRTAQALLNPHTPGLTHAEQRAIVRAKAMRLHRVRITNLDPNDAALPGAIKTVYNKFCGKVSKYIPFGEENELGYHVPEILLNSMREERYPMRKEIKQRGQSFGVKQYKTVLMPRFAIEELPPLSKEEVESLAKDQKARGAVDAHD